MLALSQLNTKPAEVHFDIDRPDESQEVSDGNVATEEPFDVDATEANIPPEDRPGVWDEFADRWAEYEYGNHGAGNGDNLPVLYGGGNGGIVESDRPQFGSEQPARKKGRGVVAGVALVAVVAALGAGYKLVQHDTEPQSPAATAPAHDADKGSSPVDKLSQPSTTAPHGTVAPESHGAAQPAPVTSHAHKHTKATHSPKPETTTQPATSKHSHPVKPAPVTTTAETTTSEPTPSSTAAPTSGTPSPTESQTTSPTETAPADGYELPGDMLATAEQSVDDSKRRDLLDANKDLHKFFSKSYLKQLTNSLDMAGILAYQQEAAAIYGDSTLAATLGTPPEYTADTMGDDSPTIAQSMVANTDFILEKAPDTLDNDPTLKVIDLAYLDNKLRNNYRHDIRQGAVYTDAQDTAELAVTTAVLKDESSVNLLATWADYGEDDNGDDVQEVRWSMPVPNGDGSFTNVTLAETPVTSADQPKDWWPWGGDGSTESPTPTPTETDNQDPTPPNDTETT
ncbi:MAG TPA: hypothetical protein VFL85_00575, partial [Candidatus Saccharimonadales bacterium]|nr:hypothetical protein [Candidatus Saccharimonadales bacterium]